MTKIVGGGKERYGLALLLILTSMIFIMAAPEASWSRAVALALQASALLASFRAAESPKVLRFICVAVLVLSLVAGSSLTFLDGDTGSDFVRWASLVVVLLSTPIIALGIIRQVKENRQVTIHTMMGVLCIYLLLGLAFASGFAVIQISTGEPFFRGSENADTLSNYLYFSLTTITTAGLGDFAPADDLGRSLTAAEALVGQIYLVTIVAVIVGNLGRKR